MSDSSKLGKIFIGGLSYETTDEKLRSYFSTYGSVTDAVVMKDPISRRSRGFGFITYADPACVDRALAQSSHILDSRRVEAKRAVPRADSLRESSSTPTKGSATTALSSGSNTSPSAGATKKIFVGGLHYETKDAEFKKYFQKYGKVVSAEVMFNRETSKSRGFGFVVFENEQSVDLILNERDHMIDGKSVEVKRAVPRTDAPSVRAVTSRGNLSSAPGSVESGEDSCSNANAAKSGIVLSSNSALYNQTGAKSASTKSSANLLPNGTLRGYAAAVRYGGRGAPKNQTPTNVSSPSSVRMMEKNGFLDPSAPALSPVRSSNHMTSEISLGGVADALSSLNIKEENSPRTSKASSDESGDKLPELYGNDHAFEGFKHSVTSSLSTPHWQLSSSVSPAVTSPAASDQLGTHNFAESSFLSDALSDSTTNLPWQPSWQQSWRPNPVTQSDSEVLDQNSRSSCVTLGLGSSVPSSSTLFSMFSPTNGNAWGSQRPEETSNLGFGGMIGIDLHRSSNPFGDSIGMGLAMGSNNMTSPSLSGIFSDNLPALDSSDRPISTLDSMLGGSFHLEDSDAKPATMRRSYGLDQDHLSAASSLGSKVQESNAFSFQQEHFR